MKLLLYVLLLCSLHDNFAQKRGYIIIASGDSTVYKQAWLEEDAGNDPQYVFFRKSPDLTPERYAVDSIIEFGFNNGRKWITKEIAGSKQFLEVIQSGTLNLLGYFDQINRVFFIEQNSTLVELNESPTGSNSFINQLKTHIDACHLLEREITHLKYKKKPLRFFVSNYNNNKCVPIPFRDFGVGIGITSSKLRVSEVNLSSFISGGAEASATNLAIIAYADIPLWRANNFSLYNELTFGTIKYKTIKKIPNNDIIFKLDLTYLQYSFAPKYTLPFEKVRPYLQTGFTVRSILKEANLIGSDNGSFGGSQEIYLSKMLIGYNIGTGLEFHYKSNQYFSLECQYKGLAGVDGYRINDLSLLFKINF